MSKKFAQPQSESEYARAVWVDVRELERETGYRVQVSMYETTRLGIWDVTIRALNAVDGAPRSIYCQRRGEWPNSMAQSYWGLVWALLHQLREDMTTGNSGLDTPLA